jgi:SAM-dependent methyltransferase
MHRPTSHASGQPAGAPRSPEQPAEYHLGASQPELDRLVQQAEVFAGEARWLLDQLPIAPDWRALDVGCGPLGILDLLDERIGEQGEVVGLDLVPRMLDLARAVLAQRGLGRVRLVQGDASGTGLPRESFDLVHQRLVLVNVETPERIVAEIAALARPGGWVALEEIDAISHVCDPPHPSFDRLLQAEIGVWTGDLAIGRKLPRLLRAAGLTEIGFRVHARWFQAGNLLHSMLPNSCGCTRTRSSPPAR